MCHTPMAITAGGLIAASLLCSISSAQERPAFFVKKFNTSKIYRNNVCQRQRAIWNGSLTLPNALQGLNITVVLPDYQNASLQDTLFKLVDGKINENDPGLLGVIMDEVARRGGFYWRNSFATFSPLNSTEDENKTWTDILTWGIETFDVSNHVWGNSIERQALGISFPAGWYDSSIVIAERLDSTMKQRAINTWAFVNPFHWLTWLVIVGFVIVTGLLYWLFEFFLPDSDVAQFQNSPIECIYHTSMVVTGTFGFQPNTHAARLLSFSWTFWVLFVVSAYVANLASHLVTRDTRILRIGSLEEAYNLDLKVCVQKGAVVESILKHKYPDLKLIPKEIKSEILIGLRNNTGKGDCTITAHELNGVRIYERDKALNYDCSISSNMRIQQFIPSGMATALDTANFRCTSLVSSVLDYHLLEMISDGFIENAWASHLNKVSTIDCLFKPENSGQSDILSASSLVISDVAGLFWLHIILSILSVTLALGMSFQQHRNSRNVLRMICGASTGT
jgi:Ligand-gated ion channel